MQRNQASLFVIFLACTLFGVIHPATGAAQTELVSPRLTGEIDPTRLVVLKGNTHPLARPEFDQGLAPDELPMERIMLLLKRNPEQDIELQELLDAQQDPGSPSYHQWLTPEQFGERFGPAPEDIAVIIDWLQKQGFSVAGVAKGRNVIEFSGTAEQVGEAFHTEIHKYLVNGKERWANASDPQIPEVLAPVIAGIVSLHNFEIRHIGSNMSIGATPHGVGGVEPLLSICGLVACTYFIAPGDFWTIYHETPILTGSPKINGTGVTIGIVGRGDVSASDISSFRSTYLGSGYPGTYQQIINGPDPGSGIPADVEENTLDVEWATATAPGANILFVTSETDSLNGMELSAQYLVDNNPAAVVSVSYGACEQSLEASGNTFFNGLWEQAAAQGITVVVGAGDSGAAGCDIQTEGWATKGLAVSGMASTPFNIAVGGTMFNEGSGTYWSPTETSTPAPHTSALGYIPEEVWNQSFDLLSLSAGGGGASSCAVFDSSGSCSGYPQPSWQTGIFGSLSPGVRNVPDVSLSAASHDAYIIYLNGAVSSASGTSVSTPAFAGVMALVNQKAGARQGLANPVLYKLAASEFGSSGNSSCISANVTSGNTCIFYDITSGNNSVPGQTGYIATTGYDQATGLGSVNIANLVNAWKTIPARASSTITVQANPTSITTSGSTILTATVPAKKSLLPTGIVTFEIDGLSVGTGTLTGSGTTATTTLNLSGNSLPVGSDTLKAYYGGDSNFAGSVSSAFTLTVSAVAGNVTTTAATSVTTGSATLQGSVNPEGSSGYAYFAWGIDPNLLTDTSQVAVTANTTTHLFSSTVTGLTCGVTYFFRIIFHDTSNNTYQYGNILSFKTLLPVVTTKAASAVSTTTATLKGSVNPEGATGNAYFLFGTDPLLTNGVTEITNTAVVANTTTQNFVGYVNLLTPGTTYYYRMVFLNTTNNSYQTGAIVTFKAWNVLTLGSGHTLNGNLSTSAPAGHCNFKAPSDHSLLDLSAQSAPTVVTFLLSSTAFDSFICVLDASNNLLAQDDDSAGNLNATTTISLSPAKYYVEASSFSGKGNGAYTLSAVAATIVTPGTVSMGNQVVANLASSATHGVCAYTEGDGPANRWKFTLTTATTLTIDAASTAFATTACLLNSSNQTLDFNDHSGSGTNARLVEQNLPSGTYYIEVSSHSSPFAGGAYRLSLQTGLPPGKPISKGKTLSGNLLPNAADGVCAYTEGDGPATRWAFTLTATTTLTMNVTSTAFATTACLLNSANQTLDFNDHSGPSTNARLVEQNLPLGTYYIEVSSHSSPFTGGAYTLSLQTGLPPGTLISLGQTLSGNLLSSAAEGVCAYTEGDGPADRWTFTLTAATTLTINVSSTVFKTTACLLNSANQTLDFNDHSGPSANARLVEQNLPLGTYYIEVSSHSSPFTGGAYTLALKTGLPPGTAISLGQTLSGNLLSSAADGVCAYTEGDGPADRWTFTLTAATTLTINVSSTVFKTTACLLNSANQTLDFNDHSGPASNARLVEQNLPLGTYYIEVSSHSSPFTGGAYTLALKTGLPPGTAISLGQTLSGNLASSAADGVCAYTAGDGPADRWQFSLSATTTITITGTSSVFHPTVCLLNSANSTQGFNSAGSSGKATLTSSNLGAGTYYIEVSSANSPFVGGAYTLSLQTGAGSASSNRQVPRSVQF